MNPRNLLPAIPALAVMGFLISTVSVRAEQPLVISLDLEQEGGHSGGSHHGEHAFHRHHAGVFLGYAVKDADKRKDGFKIGVEYEYQFLEWIGVRGFFDYEAGDLQKVLLGAGAAFHVPRTGLGFLVGGGVETTGGHTDEFVRLSGEYKFPLTDTLSLAPTLGYDFGRKDSGAFFAGVMVGVGF